MDLIKAVQTESLEKIKVIVQSKSIPINSKWLDYAALNSAIECKRNDVAKFFLENKCRVNKTSKSNVPSNTPLHNAISLGDLELITSLLASEASVTAVNSEGDTPLHIAFMTRQDQIVDAMLKYIEEFSYYENVKNNQGLTHLHIACSRNNGKIVENFLEAGADLNDSINADSVLWPGYRAIHFAVHFGSLEVVTVLRKANNYSNVEDCNGYNPLKLAYEKLKDLSAMVHVLSTENMNVESTQCRELSYFHMSCLRDDPVAVETFIKNGADVNLAVSCGAVFCPMYTPLHFAVESNCKQNVALLLAHGADVQLENIYGMTPLHLALYNENHKQKDTIVDLLYNVTNKEFSKSDANKLSYFHIAVTRNDLRLVKKFLTKDDDVDVNDPILWNLRKFSHCTPLHLSVLYGHQEMTELLIKRGCNFNRTDCGLYGTPLHLAIESGHKGIMNLLLDKGANVNKVRNDDRTVLHLLVEFCVNQAEEDDSFLDYIERLVKLGCDVNAKDVDGNTALHLACSKLYNGAECARTLLDFGADIDLENEKGNTPFNMSFFLSNEVDVEDYVMLYEHVQKLRALGIKVNPKNEICCEILVKPNQQLIDAEKINRVQQDIENEIAKLKSVKFNKRMTLLDFLLFDLKRLTGYVHNNVLNNTIENEALDELYPLYAYLIKLQYNKGMENLRADGLKKRAMKDLVQEENQQYQKEVENRGAGGFKKRAAKVDNNKNTHTRSNKRRRLQ